MSVAIVTGSAGLIGAEAVRFFSGKGFASRRHRQQHAAGFLRRRRLDRVEPSRTRGDHSRPTATTTSISATRRASKRVFAKYGKDIALVIHTAAQPSHDWAAKDPHTDFSVNANGTLVMLEATRKHCPEAVFIYHLHEQGLRRQSEQSAPGGTGDALGSGPRASLCRARHRRIDVASTRPSIRCSASRSSPPTCWCRSMAAISA